MDAFENPTLAIGASGIVTGCFVCTCGDIDRVSFPPSQLGHTVLIVILVLNMKTCYIYKITFHVILKFGVNESSSALLMVHYTYFIDVF